MQTEKRTEKIYDTYQKQFLKYKDRADFVSFKLVQEKTRDLSARNGKPDGIYSFHDQGIFIEVMVNGHIGYGGTCEVTAAGIEQAFNKALCMSKACEKHKLKKFPVSVRPKAVGTYTSPKTIGLDQLSMSALYDFLKATSQKMKLNDHIVTSISDAMLVECQQHYLSSVGSDFHQSFDIVVHSMMATAVDGNESQTRSFHGGRSNSMQVGAEYFNLDKFLPECEVVAKEAIELLHAENCPSTTCDLVLAPDQMQLQIHESIGHPLELDRILGDERNYAGWSFVKPEDFGTLQYGSALMNVVFDPTQEHAMASYKFDEAGNPAEKKYLIQNGKLIAGLGSLESQMRSELSGVANTRASSWNRPPIDRMANINLEAGNQVFEQMLSQIENGIIMFSNRSWSIDDYRRKFQFGCEYSKRIENGKLTKTYKNPNYRGITVPFWQSLAGLSTSATEQAYGAPYCGKGEPNQLIRVSHSSPYAWFKNIEVFGG